MNAHESQTHASADLESSVPRRGVELPAAVAIAWSLAGGMLLGGAAVVGLIATGRMGSSLMLTASASLFAVGALVGLLHGVVLGLFGRAEGTSAADAGRAMAHGLLYLVPALLLGWLTAGWMAALPVALAGRHVIATGVSLVAWAAMLVTVFFALRTGLRAAGLAYRRWPQHVVGTALVVAVLVTLAARFALHPPTLWPTDRRLAGLGAMILALACTFWLFGPVITVGLWLADRVRPGLCAFERPSSLTWKRLGAGAGVPVAAGLVLALIALPFHLGTVRLPSEIERFGFVAAMAVVLSRALTAELFMRLFALTLAFVVATRFLPRSGIGTAAVAIVAAAMLDLAIQSTGIPALGLPGAVSVTAYAVVRFLIPALVFGYLFWRRGLVAAIGAHVAADLTLAVLAL